MDFSIFQEIKEAEQGLLSSELVQEISGGNCESNLSLPQFALLLI